MSEPSWADKNFHPELYLQYFGREAASWESLGQLHTDIYGLSTATAVWVSPITRISYPDMDTVHPFWNFLYLERRTVTLEYGMSRATCEYAGFEGAPIPVEEWSSGISEEPITTHPNFLSFAGTAGSENNNAIFRDGQGNISHDPAVATFSEFGPGTDFAGVTSYVKPVTVQRITSIAQSAQNVGVVGTMSGTALITAASSTKRGRVYVNVIEYRYGGWNAALYN
jgi:hypothetical protein